MDFEGVIQALADAQVDFVIIGGVSATIHGSARVTYDLDICYSRSSGNLRNLTKALAPFHPRPRGFPDNLPFVWDPATLRNATVLTLATDLGDLDLLAEVAGVGAYDAVLSQAVPYEAFGRSILTLSLPALIDAKRAAARKKDLEALEELESLREASEPEISQKLNDSPK